MVICIDDDDSSQEDLQSSASEEDYGEGDAAVSSLICLICCIVCNTDSLLIFVSYSELIKYPPDALNKYMVPILVSLTILPRRCGRQ